MLICTASAPLFTGHLLRTRWLLLACTAPYSLSLPARSVGRRIEGTPWKVVPAPCSALIGGSLYALRAFDRRSVEEQFFGAVAVQPSLLWLIQCVHGLPPTFAAQIRSVKFCAGCSAHPPSLLPLLAVCSSDPTSLLTSEFYVLENFSRLILQGRCSKFIFGWQTIGIVRLQWTVCFVEAHGVVAASVTVRETLSRQAEAYKGENSLSQRL